MKTSIKTLVASITVVLFSGQLLAATPILDKREHKQTARIKQGVKSGELTKKEAKRLAQGQKQLRKMELKAKADGVVTKKESAKLQHKANKESRKIYRNKHDNQDRD